MTKKIFYGIAGEGLGHTSRALSLIENLKEEVHICTWGDSYSFLKKMNYPHLHEIIGIPFGRSKNSKIGVFATILSFLKFVFNYRKSFKEVLEISKDADLFISDFEPIIPRVANKLGKPLISIDNQHRFSRCLKRDLPIYLKLHAFLMGLFTETYIPNPSITIISTFYENKIKNNFKNTFLTNSFMRKKIDSQKVTRGDYVVVYYKNSCGDAILKSISKAKVRIKVYNCPLEKRIYRNMEYQDVSDENFIKDLAGCRAVFGCAGNQLISEAIYYNKPILVVPEPNQPEQYINAFYLRKSGCGDYLKLNKVNENKINEFLSKTWCVSLKENGVKDALYIVKNNLM